MKVTHIEGNTYEIYLLNTEQTQVESTAKRLEIDDSRALRHIIIRAFNSCYEYISGKD